MTATRRPLVLASTSRYRRALMDATGLPYAAAAPDFYEDHALPLDPEAMVLEFARGKAESLGTAHPEALIIGSDQGAEIDGRLLGKPGDLERATDQLLELAGREHRLLTAVAVHDPISGRTESGLAVHHIRMRSLSRELARTYVERDQTADCAGAYKFEGAGSLLFESVNGPEPQAIVGLPLSLTATLLARFGFDALAAAMNSD